MNTIGVGNYYGIGAEPSFRFAGGGTTGTAPKLSSFVVTLRPDGYISASRATSVSKSAADSGFAQGRYLQVLTLDAANIGEAKILAEKKWKEIGLLPLAAPAPPKPIVIVDPAVQFQALVRSGRPFFVGDVQVTLPSGWAFETRAEGRWAVPVSLPANGQANGQANGRANGRANGQANGEVTGSQTGLYVGIAAVAAAVLFLVFRKRK